MNQHEPVYEMLWDCKYCGRKKLLGITHRFCAGCGAPQDPSARYFPPDNEKVAVHNHPYVGADVTCPACRQPMSRAATCCTNCGSPLDKGVDVARRADVVIPPPGAAPHGPPFAGAPAPGAASFQGAPQPGGAPATAPKKSSSAWIFALVGGVLFVMVSVLLVAVFWKREGVFEVMGHSWERNLAIERREAVKKSMWCDDVPSDARVLGRRKEQNGTKKEPDGQECGMRKKDLGNGSYKEVKECKPKYKDVPVMEDKCDIEVLEWRKALTLTEKGSSLAETPRWPQVRVSGGTCVGCEREGARTERYTVNFIDKKSGRLASCDVPEARWSRFKQGSKWKGSVRVMTSGLDCDALVGL